MRTFRKRTFMNLQNLQQKHKVLTGIHDLNIGTGI